MVAIVGIASCAGWCAWRSASFGDECWWPAQFQHGDAVRTDGKQSEAPPDGMRNERFKVLGSHGLEIAIDFGIFSTLPVQTSRPHFIQDNPGKFRTTADDGRIGADLLEISEHLGDGVDHIGVRNGSLDPAAHR